MAYYKKYKGKLLGPYEYERPTHLFNEKDVARIAKIVAQRNGGNGAVKVLASVAAAVGLGSLICKSARSVRSALSLTAFLRQLGTTLAVSQFVALIIQTLINTKPLMPRALSIITAVIISALMVIYKTIQSIDVMLGDRAIMLEITATLDDMCRKVQELGESGVDYVCDAEGDVCKALQEEAKEAAWFLKSDIQKATDLLINTNWWDRWLDLIFD